PCLTTAARSLLGGASEDECKAANAVAANTPARPRPISLRRMRKLLPSRRKRESLSIGASENGAEASPCAREWTSYRGAAQSDSPPDDGARPSLPEMGIRVQ